MIEINKVYNEDCLVGMQNIDNKSIDMILCDLPYGTTANKWDTIIPFDKIWQQYKRIIKNNGAIVLTGSQPFTSKLICSNIEMFRYEWIWEKSKASNFLQAGYMPLKAHENVLIFSKNKTKFNPQKESGKPYNKGLRKNDNGIVSKNYHKVPNADFASVNESGLRNPRTVQYFITAETDGKQLHPTQKPVALFEYLIKTYTNENDLVLDNCMGSGTTALACQNTNRNFIGFELDTTYYQICIDRIEKNRKELEIKNNVLL